MDLIKYGWHWLTFLLHRLNTITTNHSILHTPFMAPSASLWRWWTCKTKRPAWTQEYSVHVCSMLNNVELWHTVVITIQFQCHVVSADCTCKMELLLPVRMQNLPIKSGHEGRAQVDPRKSWPTSRETAKLPCANLQRVTVTDVTAPDQTYLRLSD